MTSDAPPKLARGTSVGRFVVEEHLASGGMGALYKAHDPELDRRVAIKLVRAAKGGARDDVASERLLREARMTARLVHPNVVTVFEAGTFRGDVFIAMEFVDGVTIREWSRTARSVDAVIDVLRAAGEGLAAAHAAGMVHRDFKPDNVLVGADGRVRVVDFGLARAADASDPNALWSETLATTDEEGAPGGERDEERQDPNGAPLTRAGALLGTPRYMAPEQLLGLGVDARTDQFSFAVTLFEALYGRPPFEGSTRRELTDRVASGVFTFPTTGRAVPGWLRAVLTRALKPVPVDRFPSMTALLTAMREGRRRRRAIAIGAAVAAALLLSLGLGYAFRARSRPPLCVAATESLAGVWDDKTRASVRAAFAGTGLSFAPDALRHVEHALDSFAASWLAMRQDACVATLVSHTQSAELMDLRIACLDERLDHVRAAVGVLSTANAKVVERADALLPAPDDLSVCADATLLRSPVRPPTDAAMAARAKEVAKKVANARALLEAGRSADALTAAKSAAEEAEAIGHRPTEAEAFLVLGAAMAEGSDYKGAETMLRRAALAGEAGHDDDAVARARIRLVDLAATEALYPEADARTAEAEAAVERCGLDEHRAALDHSVSVLLSNEGKYDDAEARGLLALSLDEKLRGTDDPSVADVLQGLGHISNERAHLDVAEARYRRATSILERALGPNHPRVARAHMNIGSVLRQAGRYDESTAEYERSMAILERAYGPDYDVLATALVNLGNIALKQQALDKALGDFRHAEAIWEKKFGSEHPNVGTAELRIGMVLAKQGHPAEALERYERARRIWEKALGADNATVAVALTEIGSALLDQGKVSGAIDAQEKAIAMCEKALGPTHPELAKPLVGLGAALLAAGRAADARVPLERALHIYEASTTDPLDLAESRFTLARALRTDGKDPVRARDLATQARETFARDGERDDLRRADEWLSSAKP